MVKGATPILILHGCIVANYSNTVRLIGAKSTMKLLHFALMLVTNNKNRLCDMWFRVETTRKRNVKGADSGCIDWSKL